MSNIYNYYSITNYQNFTGRDTIILYPPPAIKTTED